MSLVSPAESGDKWPHIAQGTSLMWLRTLRWGGGLVILDYPDGANLITWVLKSGRGKRKNGSKTWHEKNLTHSYWLGRWKKEAMSQGVWAATRHWECFAGSQQETRNFTPYCWQELGSANNSNQQDSPLEPYDRNRAYQRLDFSPGRPCLTYRTVI